MQHRRLSRIAALFLGHVLLSLPLPAQAWKEEVIKVKVDTREVVTEVAFEYTPASTAPDAIPVFASFENGVTLEKGRPDPETSAIKFIFRIPVGVQSGERTIHLPYTLGKKGDPLPLRIDLSIEESANISPRVLIWRRGEEAAAKTSSLVLVTPEGYELKSATPSSKLFSAEITKSAPHLYQIAVTPVADLQRGRSIVRLDGITPGGDRTSFNLYLEVR